MFSTLKFLKINWLKNLSKECGAQAECIRLCDPTNIIIKSWTVKHGQLWSSCDATTMLRLILKNHGIYEIISRYPHKVYFDIDCVDKVMIESKELLLKVIERLNALFPDSDMSVSGSVFSDDTKCKESYHIVLNNYMIKSVEDRIHIKSIVKHLSVTNPELGYDWKVYTDNRAMKSINQTKPSDTRVQSIIINPDPKKHLITCYFNIEIKNTLPDLFNDKDLNISLEVEKVKRVKLDICKLPSLELPQIEFDLKTCTALQVLELLPLNPDFDHSYTHLVSRFCYYNELTYLNFISWYNRKRNDEESKLKWLDHWSNLLKFPIVTLESMKYILLKYYPSLIKEKKFVDYQRLFNLCPSNLIRVDTLDQSVYDNEKKYIILNTNMGSGKTFQTIDYLKDKDSFIWMTPLISLSLNTMERLTTAGINCKNYKDCKNITDKNNLNHFDKIVICINSLKYITRTYKIVVIDEIETLLNKWFNNQTLKEDIKDNCWKSFLHILRSADKVILLDAFTSRITLDFIQYLEYNTQQPVIIERKIEESNRQVCFLNDYSHWISDIILQLKAGKKLFIFYPLKDSQNHRKLPSMEGFVNILEKETGMKGIYYHGEVDQRVIKGLETVNKTWSKYNFVVTNTKITVGVNFEFDHFDLVYLGVGGWNSARDLLQVSYRCRKLKENLIKVTFIDTINTNRDFKKYEVSINNCEIYKGLVSKLLIEKHAPLQESLYFLFGKAKYKIVDSNEVFDKNLKAHFKKLFDDLNITYNYTSIENIHPNDVENYQLSIMSQEATQLMQIQMKKYYYDNLFNLSDTEEIINKSIGWDKNYESFFESIKCINLDNPFSKVFNNIKELNKWKTIIPFDEDLTDIKMDKKIKEELYKLFYFKDLSETSSSIQLLKSSLNTFFGKYVISCKMDKNEHVTYFIKDRIKQMYNFATKYLKLPENKYIYSLELYKDE